MIRAFLCRIGLHSWAYVRGTFNTYHQCSGCGARTIRYGIGGYQPIDRQWLGGK
jgi:hypothetical protein